MIVTNQMNKKRSVISQPHSAFLYMQKKNCNKLHCPMKSTSTINEACFDD